MHLRLGAAAAIAASLVVGGCEAPRPEPSRPLGITQGLSISFSGPRNQRPSAECAIADDLRIAYGCLPIVRLPPKGDVHLSDGGDAVRTFGVPRRLRGQNLSLDRSFKTTRLEPWTHLPRILVGAPGRKLDVSFPGLSGDLSTAETRVAASPLAQASTFRLESAPVAVSTGMVLDGAISLDPATQASGAQGARFVIEATVLDEPGGTEILFDRRLEATGAAEWHPYRLELSSYAGRQLQLDFRSEATPPGDRPLTGPIWAAPALLAPTAPRPNVLLISLDTLRADSVGTYGAHLPTTPVLDAFGADGVVFEDALATFPSTTASHMSMLTGTYPSVHGVLAPARKTLHPEIPTLAQSFASAGYNTAAFTENGMIVARAGFARGFRSYREFKRARGDDRAVTKGHVDRVVSDVLAWLDTNAGDSFFIFAHTYEVHGPHDPPDEFRLFEDSWADTAAARSADLVEKRNLYAGEIRYTDREIGRLLDGLAERGLAESTIVVVTSDHGESFGEHGLTGHSHSLYSELLQIPLMIRAPGLVAAGSRISTPVSLIDIAPTVLDLTGLPVPAAAQGESMVPLLEGRADDFPERFVFAELRGPKVKRLAVHNSARKWIVGSRGARIFDRERDPDEKKDLSTDEEREGARELRDRFDAESTRVRDAISGGVPAADAPPLDGATTDKLRALGYIE